AGALVRRRSPLAAADGRPAGDARGRRARLELFPERLECLAHIVVPDQQDVVDVAPHQVEVELVGPSRPMLWRDAVHGLRTTAAFEVRAQEWGGAQLSTDHAYARMQLLRQHREHAQQPE